jgi:glycosyltransferase involved in cell wall biosynthesis
MLMGYPPSHEAAHSGDPAVTVIMPVRNAAGTLGLTLQDLVQDAGPSDEILVIDDGSEDGSTEKLAQWARGDSRIRSIRTTGVGLAKALNLAIREASNDLLLRADADDRYPPGRFSAQRFAFGPEVVLISGDYEVVNGGSILGRIPSALKHPFVSISLRHPQRIPHPGVALRREAVIAAGGYRDAEFPAEDLGLWLRLRSFGIFTGVPHTVCRWNMRATSTSHSRQAEQRRMTQTLLATLSKSRRSIAWTEDELARELDSYPSTQWSEARLLLLLRDIASDTYASPKRTLPYALLRELAKNPIKSGRSAAELGRDTLRRRKLRQAWAR